MIYDELQEAHLCLLTIEDNTRIELISGKQVEQAIKKGIQYCHMCYEVDDIEQTISNFTNKGAILISPPKPAKLFKNRKVAFVYLSYGLVEFLETA